MAAELGVPIRSSSRPIRVSNGDGSFQIAAGETTVALRIGPRFQQYFTFVVIDLAQYDYIIGLPDIAAYKLELRCEPVRVVAKVGGQAVELPLTFEDGATTTKAREGTPHAEGWTMSLLTFRDFDKQVGEDPVYRIIPDGSGQLMASLHTDDTDTEDIEWAAVLHSLKTDVGANPEALDAAEAEAEKKDVQIKSLGQRLNAALASKVQELSRYRSEFFGRLRQVIGNRDDVRIVGDRFVLQSELLFAKGSADLGEGGRRELGKLATTLLEIAIKMPEDIDWILRIDGHTDSDPISTAQFPSNWELSTARALSVVHYLVSEGIPAKRLAATGFGTGEG